MSDRCILLVDDQPLVLSAIAHYLTQHGYEVHTAGNGKEALAVIEGIQPNLVITDVIMPVMDGWKLIRSLRATPRFTLLPVIVLTDQDSSESRIQGFTLGADDFVSKTTLVQELEIRINRALERGAAIARAVGADSRTQRPTPLPTPQSVAQPAPRPPTETAEPFGGLDLPPLAQAMGQPSLETPPPPPDPAPAAATRPESVLGPAGSPGIQGSLEDIGLASVLTLLESGARSGVLTIDETSSHRKARILVREGQALKISLDPGGDDLSPVKAIARIMGWRDALFSFSHQDVTAHDEIHLSTEHLLMEASQHLDEASS